MSKTSLPSRTVVLIRLVLLAAAAGALILGIVVPDRDANQLAVSAQAAAVDVIYVCPMHPDVTSSSPGNCPICRMALEPKAKRGARSSSEATLGTEPPVPESIVLSTAAQVSRFDEIAYGKNFELSREMRAPAWAESRSEGVALFCRDEIALLESDETALFFPSTQLKSGVPVGIKVRRTGDTPTPWDDVTLLVRFKVDGASELTPEQTGTLKFATRVRNSLVVRESSVVRSPSGPYVLLVAKDNRTITKRAIEIGKILSGHATIMSGLKSGERVAATNTLLIDTERRFGSGVM